MFGGYAMTHDLGWGPFHYGETDIEILYASSNVVVTSVGGNICIGVPGECMKLVIIPIDGGETEDVLNKDNVLQMNMSRCQSIAGHPDIIDMPVDQFAAAIDEAVPKLPDDQPAFRGQEYQTIKEILRERFSNELDEVQDGVMDYEMQCEVEYCRNEYQKHFDDWCSPYDAKCMEFVDRLAKDCYFLDREQILEIIDEEDDKYGLPC